MHPSAIALLVERLDEAALDETAWLEALQAYADAFGGVGVVISQPGLASPIASVSLGLLEALRPYNDLWWQEDVIVATAHRLGLIRPVRGGRIQLASPADQRRFDARLHGVICQAHPLQTPDILPVPRSDGLFPLLVRITPLTGRACEELGGFTPSYGTLVLVLDPSHRSDPEVSTVPMGLGLTLAQTRVALLVAARHSTRSAAERLGIGEETTRSHLKGVYVRLEIDRQAEVVRLTAQPDGIDFERRRSHHRIGQRRGCGAAAGMGGGSDLAASSPTRVRRGG